MKLIFVIAAVFAAHQVDGRKFHLYQTHFQDVECPEVPNGENIYFPVPGDCSSFYECSNGVPIKMPCPPGQEWGQEIKRCDLPEVAKCSDGGTATSTEGTSTTKHPVDCPAENPEGHDVFFPVPGDCTSFYKCNNGVPVKIPCPPGQEWGQHLERCDWPELAQCSTNTTFTTGPSTQSTSQGTTEKPPVDCPAENPEGHDVFFPVPGDCTSFYKCYNGVPVKIPCPPGQEWGQHLERCDWPELAQCSKNTTSTQGSSTQSSSQGTTEVPPVDCPAENPEGHDVLFPVPGDCTSFYKCYNGVPVKIPCPPGQEWAQHLERCDWPEIAQCSFSPSPTESTTTVSTEKPPVDCPAENPEGHDVYFPVPGDCTSYYECSNGVPIKMKCPSGQEWSQELERCDWPEVAKCSTNNDLGISGIECPDEDPEDHDVLFPVPDDCTSFYKCNNGVPVKQSCPAGLEWSQEFERCEWPEVAECSVGHNTKTAEVECPAVDPEDHDVLFPVPGDCTSFYKCNNGIPVKQSCPAGLEWSQELERCDYPEVAKCSVDHNTESGEVDCPAEDPEDHDVLFPVPDDCTSFYKCNNGVPVKQSCPAGLEWSQELERCDWPQIAQCSTRLYEGNSRSRIFPQRKTLPNGCPEENGIYDVFITIPGDCYHYLQCDHGETILKDCPPGTEWFDLMKRCDFPQYAKCVNNN